ncbi:MAG: hypothetical protein VX072_05135 [Pseudomonadota bacterium]|nr:hypothetical protein [Pseudomonadota bacterium]
MNYPRRIFEIVSGLMAVIFIALGGFELNALTVIGMLCAFAGLGVYAWTEIIGFGLK